MNTSVSMNPNKLVSYLKKSAESFTKDDIIKFCVENDVRFVNFHYCGWDGKLKTLNFVIHSQEYLQQLLSTGERVDGSSLFPFVEAGKSDLYVVPRFRTAFVNPFTEFLSVDMLCSFFNREGEPFESSPQYILHKAARQFNKTTGLEMETMGELEYYVIGEDSGAFPTPDQRGYHESEPFNKFTALRMECMEKISQCGGQIKYGHSEVGNFTADGKIYEQDEIEFLPTYIEDAADQLVVAKWVMRQVAHKYGLELTFAPKITTGKAGSGMHVHCKFTKNGKSVMVENGAISEIAKKAIAGYMIAGTSLPAFGNPHPLCFMRLVPHQEAPTSLCWSYSNRSALVRVPLGWTGKSDMVAMANPAEKASSADHSDKQTFEWRASDGFADMYLLMAALCCAARHGFENHQALEVAEKTYVGVNIHDEKYKDIQTSLEQLPSCCVEAAQELEKDKAIYTSEGVFSTAIVDFLIKYLKAFDDTDLRAKLDAQAMLKYVSSCINNG